MFVLLLLIAALVLVLGLIRYLMTSTTGHFNEWPKQLAVWLGIASLLPLVAWFGTAAFTPRADDDEFNRVQARLNERLGSATTPAEKESLRTEIDQRAKKHADDEHLFERRMFWVALPIGVLALVIGTCVSVQSVGSGLMFGGIGTLAEGCFEAWEYLGPWLRLGALLSVLIISSHWLKPVSQRESSIWLVPANAIIDALSWRECQRIIPTWRSGISPN